MLLTMWSAILFLELALSPKGRSPLPWRLISAELKFSRIMKVSIEKKVSQT